MTDISIRERGIVNAGPVITIDGQEYAITLTDPFSAAEEQRLEWYFEQHLKFPFTDQVKAQAAAASIATYGEALFNALFTDRRAYARYQAALQHGIEKLTFEIAGSPAFHRLHWEALKDPDLPQPFALQTPFVRRNLAPRTVEASLRSSPTINLLIVTARPGGARDVGYRTISRPLVHALRQANLRVQVDILRPGSYEALVQHLEAKQDQHGAGYYHVIHFDVHGALLTHAQFEQIEKALPGDHYTFQKRFGRADLPLYTDHKAFLFLEGPQTGQADPVAASELADLLINHQVPIVILNACQSAKQLKAAADQSTASESSLGSQLMQAGVQMVLAMAYSVTVSAAELLMQQLYTELFAGHDLSAAIRRARLELYNRKARRAYFNQTIDLEDWLLPVVYQNQPQHLQPRDFTPAESAVFYQRQANRYPDATVTYQFVGRDLDILHIERALLLQRNILLVRGMGGAGKTTLLHHLAHWWQTTGFVDQIFYFGYDVRAYTRQQIMDAIARQLLGEITYLTQFQPLPGDEVKQAFLTEQLRAARHLLILDNLESITGSALAIPNTLPSDEQAKLHAFLQALAAGKTCVLLGSRGGETWLAPQTFVDNVYDLPGLDPQAASALADLILARHAATGYRSDPDFQKLLKLLDGYPMPLEVVLANLARQTPSEVLSALQAGDVALDTGAAADDKTKNIVACIAYSHSNLSPDAQQLLLCLAPFTGMINHQWLPQYSTHLQAQPALAHLPYERWAEVLQEAINWGLLTPDRQLPNYLRVQPIFPYFLRTRLHEQAVWLAAVETAFRNHYNGIGEFLHTSIQSREAQARQTGLLLAQLEYENLSTALTSALHTQTKFFNHYEALFRYFDIKSAHEQAAQLSEQVLVAQPNYSPSALTHEIAQDFSLTFERVALSYLMTKKYPQAEQAYQRALNYLMELPGATDEYSRKTSAAIYHGLGNVALEQRQWTQAEQHYQHALALKIEFNDRYRQASTYQQLGRVAEEQQQWLQAEQYYQHALALKIEFNDRYSQAITYHQLGCVAQAQRQWVQAEQYYQHALALYIEFNDRYYQAGTYHQLGMVAQEQRQWAQAEQHYQLALALKIEFNDRYPQASTYHQLASIAQEQLQWVQADQHYQQALAIFIEFNDRYHQAGIYHNLGMVAETQRQWAQAEQYYQQALALFIEFNDRYHQAGTYHQLGSVAQGQRQWAQAEQYYQQALTLKIEFNDRHYQASTYHQLGSVAQAQRQWVQAQRHYQHALAIYIEFKDRYRQALTYGQLGLLAEAQSQPSQAANYLCQTLVIFHEFNDEHSTQITLRSLARLWQASGLTDLPTAVAAILNTTPAEIEAAFTQILANNDAPD